MSDTRLHRAIVLALILAATIGAAREQTAPARASASIDIDADKIEGRISPLMYGQFLEFMFEGVKHGLHAELLSDRGFEEPPNAIGLSRGWNRYPAGPSCGTTATCIQAARTHCASSSLEV
jgi:hypothetical protein